MDWLSFWGAGQVTIEVKKTGADSYLSQVIELVKQAQESKSKTQNLASRAAQWLTILALGGGAITLVLWISVFKLGLAFSLERMVTVMIIACPHAPGSSNSTGDCRLYCNIGQKRIIDT